MVQSETINQSTGKEVLNEMLKTGKTAEEIVVEKGLQQLSDPQEIVAIVEHTLESHPNEVNDYLQGKETISNWLFGQVMRAARGKANPQIVKRILQEKLDKRK
jgi:aspartyl-tRNA(Asn)/glutamyl-tRNA(Gln) amidotransferase subunit B